MAEQSNFPEALGPSPRPNGTNGEPARRGYPEEPEGDEISIHEIVEVLFKNKWIILACFVLMLSGVAVYTLQQTPQYQTSTTLLVNKPESSSQLSEVLGTQASGGAGISRGIANEMEILRSRRIAMRVAEELLDVYNLPGTDQRLEILGEGKDPAKALAIAQELQGRLEVRPVSREVDIVKVTVTSPVPKEAALIANVYASEYIEYNRTTSRSQVSASREFLSEITDKFSQELRSAEEELTSFLNQQSVVAPDQEASQLIGQVSNVQQQQYQTQLELGMAQAELRALKDQLDEIVPGLAKQLTSGDNQAIEALTQRITELELQMDQKYARNPNLKENPSQDPELVQIQQELDQYQARLDERTQNLIDNVIASGASPTDLAMSQSGESVESRINTVTELRRQIMEKNVTVQGLQARMELYDEQLSKYESRLGDIPRKEVIMNRLQRSLTTREELYMQLIGRLQEARIAENAELGYVDVVDEALVPGNPVRPRVQANLFVGGVLGLILGIGLAFIRNAFDNKVRKPEDLRRRGYNVAGVVPDMERVVKQDFKGQERVAVDGHDYSTRLISLLNPLSPVAEGYRRLRTNIQFSRPDKDARAIMITSPNPSEGKTVTALNLAVTMAQSGRRTLYVDADLRRPEGHRMMGLSREPGLVDLLFDSVPDNIEQFATDVDSYLYVLPAGRDVPNPAEVLGSRKMQKFLARWRQEFDVLIVDTPPTLVVSDALILASHCDATVLVCAAGETNWQSVDRSAEALHSVGADILGIMLNRFDLKAAYGGYKYGYGYGYEYAYYNNYYYGQKSSNKSTLGGLIRRS
ncbi:MAG: polysaccharide biosynthesis tyrosine autokinase [Bacteroidetes bacterium]|jgi:capsular exopolysaccharide synthesis family protein|nr:polysaccharide biosynthesis tyrosine autokinase [Bacteroidota bacterium]